MAKEAEPDRPLAFDILGRVRAVVCAFVLAGCIEPDLIPCPPPTNEQQCAPTWQPIEYPDTFMNVLSKTLVSYVAGSTDPPLAFTANMHTNQALSIRITATNGTTCLQWGYQITGSDDFSGPGCLSNSDPATFTTTHSGIVVLPGFHFTGTGSALVEYLEYGSDTPQFSKQVTWAP